MVRRFSSMSALITLTKGCDLPLGQGRQKKSPVQYSMRTDGRGEEINEGSTSGFCQVNLAGFTLLLGEEAPVFLR